MLPLKIFCIFAMRTEYGLSCPCCSPFKSISKNSNLHLDSLFIRILFQITPPMMAVSGHFLASTSRLQCEPDLVTLQHPRFSLPFTPCIVVLIRLSECIPVDIKIYSHSISIIIGELCIFPSLTLLKLMLMLTWIMLRKSSSIGRNQIETLGTLV